MRSRYRECLNLALLASVLCASSAQAATLSVGCSPAALITALNTANGNAQANTLNLAAACVYTLTTVDNLDAYGTGNGLPRYSSANALTINGNNAIVQRSTAAGTPTFRLLQIDGTGLTGTATINVHISDLTLRNGYAFGVTDMTGTNNAAGGGILASGYGQSGVNTTLVLDNVALINNVSTSYGGGLGASAFITVNNSYVSGNSAALYGGGIAALISTLAIDNSVISGNAQDPGNTDPGFISGGGGIGCFFCQTMLLQDSNIENNSAAGTGGGGVAALATAMDIRRSRIAGNVSDIPSVRAATFTSGNAGGVGIATETGFSASPSRITDSAIFNNIAMDSAGGVGADGPLQLTISNTTISGNHAAVRGGGVGDAATGVALINATIVGNVAPRSAGVDVGSFVDPNGTTVGKISFANAVIAGNTGSTDCYNDGGQVTANVASLLQSDATSMNACDGADATHFALRGNPMLSALAAHGGADLSYLPLSGSPLIDAGDNTQLLPGTTNDERGNGFARIVGAHVDIGAIESGNNDVIFRNNFEIR